VSERKYLTNHQMTGFCTRRTDTKTASTNRAVPAEIRLEFPDVEIKPDRDGTSRRNTSLRTLVWYNYTVLKLQFEKNHLLAVVADLNPDMIRGISLSREREREGEIRRDTLGVTALAWPRRGQRISVV
jgi:hypothetical protein